MRTLSIKHRLIGLTALSILATLLVAVLAWGNGRTAREVSESLSATTSAIHDSMMADMMHDAIRADVLATQAAALSNDTKALEDAQKDFDEHAALMKKSFEEASTHALSDQARAAVEAASPVVTRYLAAGNAAITALKRDANAAKPQIAEYFEAFEATEEALGKSGEAIESAAKAIQETTQHRLHRGELLTLTVISACVAALAVLSFWVIRSILTPLMHMRRAVRNLNSDDGDLSRRLPSATAEFGEVSVLFNQFLEKIAKVVGSVQTVADQISSTSAQIASGNMDLSQRTEKTSASLQGAASSMEEITATVKQSTDSAHHANQLAVAASEVAAKGGEAVSRVVTTMDEINVASRKIGDIISVIDGIAFQTNILALNAAVEAARAGEQGRGFAVVASEVRNLAQRSAEAAREIKALISTSVDKVETGSQLVREAGATMDDIVASVDRVSSMIQAITQAATEQSAGIMAVSDVVTELDHNTQQNTALVEQTAAVAKEMADQAQSLAQTVSVFRNAHAQASHGSAY